MIAARQMKSRRSFRARCGAPWAARAAAVWTACGAVAGAIEPLPRNVVLCIGDGMGSGQVQAARAWLGRPLIFEQFAVTGWLSTACVGSPVTDSAAAGTAMATGRRVANTVLSVQIPGDGRPLQTSLELHGAHGRRTGLVTTTSLTDATPAAFGAHVASRFDVAGIARHYLEQSRPHVLLGGGAGVLTPESAAVAGYLVVTNRLHMLWVDPTVTERLCGLFGSTCMPYEHDGLGTLPHLSEMTRTALDILDDDPDGLFLMIEGGRIDHACHGNDLPRCLGEMVEFEHAVRIVMEWAAGRDDTLVLVTADHETGGLSVVADHGAGFLPGVTWATNWHTAAEVPFYAQGRGGGRAVWMRHLTDVHGLTTDAAFPRPDIREMRRGAEGVDLSWAAVSGRLYQVESSAHILPPSWAPAARVIATAETLHTVRLPPSDLPGQFFRIVQE